MAESIITELKRRNVFKVAAAYIVLAWVIVQVTDQAVNAFAMPDWVNTVVFFFGLIGLPFVLIFAWAFELTPEGIKREVEVNADQSITDQTGKKLNSVIITLLLVALGYFVYESRFQESANDVVDVPQGITSPNITETAANQAPNSDTFTNLEKESLTSLPGSSIAVLPFVNMSSDPEQEYFSDGISEEILNVLAQIPNLHVTSRSSAFSFKGKEIIVSEVAEKLGVANVLEGSVRKAGNKIRITAQLIEAATDKHLWSETYDRELTDIFAVQDEISQAIVVALKDKLDLVDTEITLVATTEVNPEAHQAFLKGRSLLERRSQEDLELALAEFEKAISLEPNYAKAWMGKAWANIYLGENNYGNIPVELAEERATTANKQALKLNPDLAESYAIQATIYGHNREFEKADEYYAKAVALNPNFVYSFVWQAGDVDFSKPESYARRLELRRKAYLLDPLNILTLVNYAYSLIDYGEFEQALAIAEQIKVINPQSHLTYQIQSNAYRELHQYGKSVYARRQSHKLSPNIDTLFGYSFGLMRLGMTEEAIAVVEGTELDILKYAFKQNQEAFINQARLTLPRSENDSFGNFRRAVAETFAGNCNDAIKYFAKTNCTSCDFLLYCYKQLGATEDFDMAMEQRDEQIKFMKQANYGPHRYDGFEQEQYVLRGEMDEAMRRMFERLKQGYIIGGRTKNSSIGAVIREHPDYPEALLVSEQNRLKQFAIYQQLVAAETVE